MNPAENGTFRPLLWRALESNFVRSVLGEHTMDFYGRLVSPALTARRIFARVVAVRDEARDVKSFELRANGHHRGFRAGQHVNVFVEIGGVRHVRCYSPSNAPGHGNRLVLTIKRHERGLVSRWFHERLRVGDWIEISAPFGDFTLPAQSRDKLLFIAGGSGITPIASIVQGLATGPARDVTLLSYGRTYADLIFARELRELALESPSFRVYFAVTREAARVGDMNGHFGADHLDRIAKDAPERTTFVCGPPALVESVRTLWAERRFPTAPKTETFSPPHTVAALDASRRGTVEVTAALSGRRFRATAGAPLLTQAERAGLFPPSGCRQGICFTCACRKRSGVVRDLATGVVSSEPEEQIRLCVSEPLSDVTLDL
jgi:ferredoxin-NADP reductase